MKKQNILLLSSLMLSVVSCGSGSSSSTSYQYPPNPTNDYPEAFKCLPSNAPPSSSNSGNGLQIAYGENCKVSNMQPSMIKSELESMVTSISFANGTRYCTGTPLSYDPQTKVGYVLSAAHCVVGGSTKAAGQPSTANNITTFEDNLGYINQKPEASRDSGITGTIEAIYIPSQYCQSAEIDPEAGGCTDLSEQDGDIALMKVSFTESQSLAVSPKVRLAESNLHMPYPSYIMAMGYGLTNNESLKNTSLYYITYEYFATNSYWGETGLSTLMNGYSPAGDNAFASIICQGDSGGGDFYWDGLYWNLVGAHSYGPTPCGIASRSYVDAHDVSADVRPFTAQLQQIMAQDTTSTGCNANVSGWACQAR